ncbi:hypothetical protein OUZ56_026125 [Daphnia magna]|uniref:Retrotransposon gag domain-containing protein n=1 Tax=Daphnia magna TaxID=35525 RepID=A0ABQ9ZKZ4_9CRUS|nr:hypothetical protein OUZ56_026125 [Daphnia magna]
MQVSSQDETNRLGQLRTLKKQQIGIYFEVKKKIELTNKEVGTALRALLLTEPTILTPIELFKHCGLKTYYESTDSEYESVHSGEQQNRSESDLVPQSLVTLETEEETTKNSVPIKIVRAEIHTQGDQIPLDCPKLTPSTTTITCPAVNHSQSSMNTQISQSQLASTPCNYLPYQGLQSRKVSFTPASIVEQSNKIMQNKPSEETNQDMPIKIYVKELSRLMESGMDYEDASKAADCIVQHVLTNTKRCINSSQKTKHNGHPIFRTSSQPSYLTSTPLNTQPLALSGQSVKIPSMYNKQSNNGATPKYSVTSSIPKMNPLVMCPSKVNSIGNTNNLISNAIDKNKKLQQSRAMTLFSNVGIYVDRDRSGRFDDWLAHLESVLALGDFEESRKIILLRSKLYGEAADEFDNFKLENPISAQIYDRVKERLIKLFHSTETRSKQSVEFHNMQREPEENMRRYANRIRKAFHLAYPIKSTIDKATAFSREQIMMDRFLEGLSFDVQTRLKYKEFETFEKLIEKAEMTAMAVEEAQVRSRLNAFQAKYVEPNRELTKVKEALDRLSTQVESNTHQNYLEEHMGKMQRQLSTRRNKLDTEQTFVPR